MRRNYKIIIFLISLLFIIVATELFLRAFYPPFQIVKVTNKGNRLNDGGSLKLSNDPILLYERKDLSQTFTVKKPEDTYRIIVLGDSIVFRQEWSLNDYFPKILENLLNVRVNTLNYEVLNAGVPGYNTRQEARYLQKRLLLFSPNMVFVTYCAANDKVIKRRMVQYKDGLYCSDALEMYPYLLGLPPRLIKFLMKHSMLYRFINETLIRIAGKIDENLLNGRIEYFDCSFETEDAIKEIRDIALKERFALVFIIFPILRDGKQDEYDWVINKCQQYCIPYIGLRDIFKKTGYERIRISRDDWCHPNQIGHQLAAEEIYRYLDNNSVRR